MAADEGVRVQAVHFLPAWLKGLSEPQLALLCLFLKKAQKPPARSTVLSPCSAKKRTLLKEYAQKQAKPYDLGPMLPISPQVWSDDHDPVVTCLSSRPGFC